MLYLLSPDNIIDNDLCIYTSVKLFSGFQEHNPDTGLKNGMVNIRNTRI